jgi:Na+-transporting methylmalonyl-CoA/oxaloacetate decarboxylase gamma subunit
MALHMDDTEGLDDEAPQPIDAESVANGSFERISKDQGARSASHALHDVTKGERHTSEDDRVPLNKRSLIVIGVAAVVAIVVIVVMVMRILSASAPAPSNSSEPEQVAMSADAQISNRGSSYKLVEQEGKYQLLEVRGAGGGQNVVLGDLKGTPANLVLYDGAIIVPENLADGTWDVAAYTIGSGWSQIMDQEGKAVAGEGSVQDAQLEGSTLVLTVDGARVNVPLVW